MKKELGIAILVGVILGFTITGLFWARRRGKINLPSNEETNQEEVLEEEPTATPIPIEETVSLEIEEPENEIISQKENLTIKGKSVVSATVVIIWEEGEDILVADEEGNFETEITLIGGENIIDITAYDDEGNSASKTLTVTYSTAEI